MIAGCGGRSSTSHGRGPPIPKCRGASPSEISAFVLFLVSDESGYATATEFVVDGGLTNYVPGKI
jgi:3alpha(or 20beta)-hydroxysteroid dehydrogenase